ncbi:hypothetical protein [Anaeromyxobacter oryzisoli]|uniref:hypothetical protein n=1 Tax=Anaeromyxobacter oryzisoli TaxID=2925408 RepID=UPI001F572860|nr:hypothetical protein [Anaeromyxobacter sp. SG63]
MKVIIPLGVAVWLLSAALAFAKESANHVVLEFGLRAEGGEVAIQSDAVTMFSSGSVAVIEPGSDNWRFRAGGGAVSVRLVHSAFEFSGTHLNASAATSPGLCDPFDQIDLREARDAIVAALPSAAHVKSVIEFTDVALAIYSAPKSEPRPDLRLAVLKRIDYGRSYRLMGSALVSDAGVFCGAFALAKGHVVVLVDEPAGSSDYLAAYGFRYSK